MGLEHRKLSRMRCPTGIASGVSLGGTKSRPELYSRVVRVGEKWRRKRARGRTAKRQGEIES